MRNTAIIAVLLLVIISACSPKNSEVLVAEFGDYDITLSEFEKAYADNVGGIEKAKEDSLKDYEKFLDLYTKFRMKLRDAKVRGYDEDESVRKEYNDYKNRIGSTFIIENEITKPALKQLYDRQGEELRVSHILVTTRNRSGSEAKAIAEKVIEELNNGADWNEVCKKYSDDKPTKSTGGDIYYITSGQIFPQLEGPLYSLNEGEYYKEPLKTKYGYHVLKVTERHPRKFKVRASHILARTNPQDSAVSAKALVKINKAKKELEAGKSFAEVAKKYSEDPGSAVRGGDLGEFQRRMMVRPFDEAVFTMKEGEVSDIITTRFGYHIIKLDSVIDRPSYDEMKDFLKKQYKKTLFEHDRMAYLDTLKNEFNYRLVEENTDKLLEIMDTVRIDNMYWEHSRRNEIKDSVLFYISSEPVICDSIISIAESEGTYHHKRINSETLPKILDLVAGKYAMKHKVMKLEKTNEKFAGLMDEYLNGIYIFKIQEEEIWNRIDADSTKIKEYYEANKEKFRWPDRVDFHEILVSKKEVADSLYRKIKEGADINVVAATTTQRKGFRRKEGHFEMVNADMNEASKIAYSLEPNQLNEPVKLKNGKWSIIEVNEKDAARIKTFEEAYAEASSKFQEKESTRLEKEYINRLEKVYEPEQYKEELAKAFKEKSN